MYKYMHSGISELIGDKKEAARVYIHSVHVHIECVFTLFHISFTTIAIFGEDVGFGGVFRCSANLRDKYGEPSHTHVQLHCTCTIYVHTCTCMYMYTVLVHVHVYMCMYTHTCTCTYMYVVHVHTCTCIFLYEYIMHRL